MIVFGTSRTRQVPGPDLHINCQVCGRDGVSARSYECEEKITLYFVPLPTQRERHVVCTVCGADRLTDLPLEELSTCAPEEAERHLFHRVSLVAKAIAVASVALFGCLPLGLPLGVAAMVMNRRSGGWPFRAGLLGVVLTVLLWGGLFLRSALVELRIL